jgi:hypothetical protein
MKVCLDFLQEMLDVRDALIDSLNAALKLSKVVAYHLSGLLWAHAMRFDRRHRPPYAHLRHGQCGAPSSMAHFPVGAFVFICSPPLARI